MPSTNEENKPTVMAFATLPPPVCGATVATERFIAMTESSLNWQVKSVGRPSESARSGQLARLMRNVKAGKACLFSSRTHLKSCYMPISAGITMIYNLGFVAACAVRNIPILIHHHSYSYINRHSRSMALLNRLLGSKDGQVFLSDAMRAGFDRQYRRQARAVLLPNSYAMALNQSRRSLVQNGSPVFRIGHFSNLSIEKGLATVIEAFARLHTADRAFELHLGGPAMGPKEQVLLDQARSDFGDSVKIYGPLYGADKDRFFQSIDAFWFPSEYVNEAQPIVLVEALSYGVPCLSVKRGCIEWLLSDTGLVANDKPDFIERAVEHARRSRERLDRTDEARGCIERYAALRSIEAQGFSDAVAFLSGR